MDEPLPRELPAVAPSTESAPAATPPIELPPRVWPVFLGYLLAIGAGVVIGVLACLALVALEIARRPALFSSATAFTELFKELLQSPLLWVLSSLASASGLAGVALAGAMASKQPARLRLRTGPSMFSCPQLAVTVIGLLAVGQSSDSLISLLGLERTGMLPKLSRIVAAAHGPMLVLMAASFGLASGIAEELFFRGFMQTRLRQRWGRWAGIVISAAAFALAHLDPIHVTFALCAGIYLGWVAELGGSIRPTAVAHVVNNALGVLCMAFLQVKLSRAGNAVLLVLALSVATFAIMMLRRRNPPEIGSLPVHPGAESPCVK